MLKSRFNFLGAIMKCQRCNESEVLHESGVGFGGGGSWLRNYVEDRMVRSRTDRPSNIQFVQINVY